MNEKHPENPIIEKIVEIPPFTSRDAILARIIQNA